MMTLFNQRSELKIGKILEVNGTKLRIEIDNEITSLTRSVDGNIYPLGQVASIIKIHFGKKILFAFVNMLRMRSEIIAEESKTIISPDDDSRILEAELFGQGEWNVEKEKLKFSRGVETYPLPLQNAYLCLNDELEEVYNSAESSTTNSDDSMVVIGEYAGSNNAKCRANIDKLFGHHCAVLGSTGSGKSSTVAAIIHSILEHQINDKKINPRIIIIDPHGEYGSAFKQADIYYAYNQFFETDSDKQKLILPYWLMTSNELRSLIVGKSEHEATSQNNIVYEAISYARMVQAKIIQAYNESPTGNESAKPIPPKTLKDISTFDRDKPLPFKLSDFETHIDKIQGRKPGSTDPKSPTDRKDIDSILKKIRILRCNPQLNFLMKDYEDSDLNLQSILTQLIGNDSHKSSLKIIDTSGLPNEVAGPLTASIARLLFQYKTWQNKNEREQDPLLLVCEEAHRYVPNHGEAQYREAQDAIRRIAKEGRKYGLGLMLVSQRPADIEGTVLSQCNSWIILRLSNTTDQQHVSSFLPDNLASLTKILPALTRREALFVGEAAALPSRIFINKLIKDKLPNSHDISFVQGWNSINKNNQHMIKNIVDRWIKLSNN